MVSSRFTRTGAIRHGPTVCYPPIVPIPPGVITANFDMTPLDTFPNFPCVVALIANNTRYPPGTNVLCDWWLPGLVGIPPIAYAQGDLLQFETIRTPDQGEFAGWVELMWPNGDDKTLHIEYKNL